MYLCYLDESGDLGEKPNSSRNYLLAAAAIFEGVWSRLNEEMSAFLASVPVVPTPTELHAADLKRGKGQFSGLNFEQSRTQLDRACEVVKGFLSQEIVFFGAVYEKAVWRHKNPDAPIEDLARDAFDQICSRVDLFLRRQHAVFDRPSKAVVIADETKTRLKEALRVRYLSYHTEGTPWAKNYNLIERLFFLHSNQSPGLQVADLCAYAISRLVRDGDAFLAERLAARFDREPLTSTINPGRWHGIRYFGENPAVEERMKKLWPRT